MKFLNVKHMLRQGIAFGGLAAITLTLTLGLSNSAQALTVKVQTTEQDEFVAASHEFGVPLSVLLAVSYNSSRWQAPSGTSADGGYGLMDLRTYAPSKISGKNGGAVAAPKQPAAFYTLDQAAQLLHVSKSTLKTNDAQNIRGAAAVLAQDAKQQYGGTVPTNLNDWYGAVADFSGAGDQQTASQFADDVFSTIKSGASLTTSAGQSISLPAVQTVRPNRSTLPLLDLPKQTAGLPAAGSRTPSLGDQQAECPASLHCNFVPAAYAPDSSTDPTNYGNFDFANRPKDMQIKYIFIHDTEGSYDSVLNEFQDPASYISAQYVVRSSDGKITQMVPNRDVSWGVYDWYDNMHGINIENEGFAADGATWYTPVMYQHVATLVRWLAAKYHIPLDRQHILGHDNIPVLQAANFPNQHWDPGPFWNWNYFMNLVHGDSPAEAAADTGASNDPMIRPLQKGDVVTIDPKFATNQQTVTDCQTGVCAILPPQGTSFVYLHTQPSQNAPLLSDPYVHADNSPGTTEDRDWGDKAPAGFQYVVSGVQGDWTGIWFAGKVGWFYNPRGAGQTARLSLSDTIMPRPDRKSIPVYGAAQPEASAYPKAVPLQQFAPLYTISAGQHYATTGEAVPTDYFYDITYNYSFPDDHAIVRGKQQYFQIDINHRIGYVKASDVIILP